MTIAELIKILQACKNQNAIVRLSDTTNFYLHFDMDGTFIDFSKQARGNDYGENGLENKCENCNMFSKEEKCCKCAGKDCLNVDAVIDTKKLNESPCSNCNGCTDSSSGIATIEIKNEDGTSSKYDLSQFGINGINESSAEDRTLENKSIEKLIQSKVEIVPPVLHINPDEKSEPLTLETLNDHIQKLIDQALINTLTRMIDSIK